MRWLILMPGLASAHVDPAAGDAARAAIAALHEAFDAYARGVGEPMRAGLPAGLRTIPISTVLLRQGATILGDAGHGVAGTLHEGLPSEAITREGRVRAELSGRPLAAHASGRTRAAPGRATDFFGPEVAVSALGERFRPAVPNGRTIDWIGDPDAPHGFAHLPGPARAHIALADRPEARGRARHLPSLPPMSVREACAVARPEGAPPLRLRGPPGSSDPPLARWSRCDTCSTRPS